MDCYPVKRPLSPAVSYDPFSDALSSSDCGPYLIDEQWNGEDMEGTGRYFNVPSRGIIEVSEQKHEFLQSEQPVCAPKTEPTISQL